MKSAEIRKQFIDFFRDKGHAVVSSGSLVPSNDPTLLFTNAGMSPFKNVFLGVEERDYVRATSAQRCVRAGGKHNDLENVGYTARHHTFFEMLGNFSFGDYFKREAIFYAWEFLTVNLGLSPDRLWVTVYKDDEEAEEIWLREVGVDPERFSRLGEKDNFWSMGDTGPCGPCSEIFYDHGEAVPGGPPGSPDEEGDRYIEIWNLVFMQYNKTAEGKMQPLPSPSIDTGMGLERISAVAQGVHSNYETDSFQIILKAASELTGGVPTTNSSLRVIADHIRSCAFLIADGVLPSNEGRGYVLRRIIRRACRHGHKLGMKSPFFYKLVPALIDSMDEAAEVVRKQKNHVSDTLNQEELQFGKTLERGMKLLEVDISTLDGSVLGGETIFTLYDTYGFPVDLTCDIAREHGLTLDMAGYESCMSDQRRKARAASHFSVDYNAEIVEKGHTRFTGYDCLESEANVIALYQEGKKIDRLEGQGRQAILITDVTPFYAEAGGQTGDIGQGCSVIDGGILFNVNDTTKSGSHHLHHIELVGETLETGQRLNLKVKDDERSMMAANHSATHLLHAALRKILGDHVQQKGSLVNAEKLRFDFSHHLPLSADEIEKIQSMVNEEIRSNTTVTVREMDMDSAIKEGAMALFGEKYDDTVRVLKMGKNDFSIELCGGTHVNRTGDIGFFVITSGSAIASGVRRLEALTGKAAEAWVFREQALLKAVATTVKGNPDNVLGKVKSLTERIRLLEQEQERFQQKIASLEGGSLIDQAVEIEGGKLLVTSLGKSDAKALRDTLDQLKSRLAPCVIMLAAENNGKIVLSAGVSSSLTQKIKAGELLRFVAQQVKGKGGGRPDFAQGGGSDLQALPSALASVESWVRECL